ncbi:MAG: hypothetical protein KDD61_05500 [Bdellovibrionales bacterium]|nr:hypothetical protein [Bdellovibrionales bacterium]
MILLTRVIFSISILLSLSSAQAEDSSSAQVTANIPKLLTETEESKKVCNEDPSSPLSQAISKNPGSLLEIFCEIAFNYLPLYENSSLSAFEQSQRSEFSQSIALSILSLDPKDYNSVVLILLETYYLDPSPGIQTLVNDLIMFSSPLIREQNDHHYAVDFLDSTMVWGTTFLFLYRGLPWIYKRIPGAPKITVGKPIPPSTLSRAGSSRGSLISTTSSGKDLIKSVIVNLPRTPKWYHYYLAGAGVGFVETSIKSHKVHLFDIKTLKTYVDVNILCQLSIEVADMSQGKSSLSAESISKIKSHLSRFSESGKNKFANFYPESQLPEFQWMSQEDQMIFTEFWSYYNTHKNECQQLSVPATTSLLETLEKGFLSPRLSPGE